MIYWLGSIAQLNDIAFLNFEVKYHLESQSKIDFYQSNSFFLKIVIWLGKQTNNIGYCIYFFHEQLTNSSLHAYGK